MLGARVHASGVLQVAVATVVGSRWADAHKTNLIIDVHADDPEFGYRFIADELEAAGHRCRERRVWRLCERHSRPTDSPGRRGTSPVPVLPPGTGEMRRCGSGRAPVGSARCTVLLVEPPSEPPEGEIPPIDARFSYANERTFLAWNRTALASVTAGLAVTQLLPDFSVPGGRRMIGIPLIALGVVVSLVSLRQWQANERAMEEGRHLPPSPLPVLVAVVVGVTAVIALVLALFGGEST